ncbi:MAG TPA: hypothetical protein DEB39_14565 [Planctomycetaceae bacterium]|nr:hypothetical protein [Planctomycetaceae bacterium]
MEPYIIIPLLIILVAVLILGAESRRLDRENQRLRSKCSSFELIIKSLFDVNDRLIRIIDDTDRHNPCERNDESTSTPEPNNDED